MSFGLSSTSTNQSVGTNRTEEGLITAMYDMANFEKLAPLGAVAPAAMAAFQALDQAALAEGAMPTKYRELMAIAVALTTQC